MADPLSDQDLETVFKRFWRKDSARVTGRHAGIGLALVKSYVDLMGLEIKVSVADEIFHISLSAIRIA